MQDSAILSNRSANVGRHAGHRRRTAPRDPYPIERLRAILERKRKRTDRTGEEFSLLAFTTRGRKTRAATGDRLAAILQQRLRPADEVGWLEDEVIGVVLPATGGAAAWRVAEEVCRGFPPDCPPPACTVYCHPADFRSGEQPASGAWRGLPDAGKRVRAMQILFIRRTPAWKRCMDVAGAFIGLVLLLPLFVLIAVAIKATSRGPIFYSQWRDGRGGKRFVIYKFRSMVVGADADQHELRELNERDGPAFKISNDPRVTWVGRLLRRTNFDELPQIWNVLKGEMSLVGPRPLPCGESAACTPWQHRRLDVTPGLTCTWQARGQTKVSFDEWMRMDIRYILSRSLWQDLKLIAWTVAVVMLGRSGH